MLTKCAIPDCSAPFRRLGDGKLCRVETEYPANENERTGSARKNCIRSNTTGYARSALPSTP